MKLVFAATFDSFRTLKDKSAKITLDTQELDGKAAGDLYSMNGKFLKVLMTDANVITHPEAESVENFTIEEDNGKSPSVRLRAVLYRNYEKDKKGYTTFEDYYRSQMEKLIVYYKGKLD